MDWNGGYHGKEYDERRNSARPLEAFAQNTAAMERFAAMSEQERQNIISMAQNVGSKAEMAAFVQKIADGHAANS